MQPASQAVKANLSGGIDDSLLHERREFGVSVGEVRMRKIIRLLHGVFFLTVFLCFFTSVASATPPAPVDIETFSVDGKVTAVISIYDAWSQQISCQEDREEAKAFYKRKGMMDTDGTLRFSLLSKQSLPGTAQEVEITMEPYEDMSRQADKKLDPFHRTAQGTAGKRLNVSVKYKIPDKTCLLVATVTLKDYYKKDDKVLPRYTTVEYEFRQVGVTETGTKK